MNLNEYFLFETGFATDLGCRREINEDDLLSRPDFGLWVVADGMGGHAAGDFASHTIVTELQSVGVSASPEDLEARFGERLIRANDKILEHAASLGRGTIGATMVALLVHGDEYSCIWSGDSRIYLLRGGRITQCTRDHTELRAMLDAGSITEEEARTWPRRNVITRAIGVSAKPACDKVTGRLQPDDCFVLCSDGLTEHLEDDEIADFAGRLPPKDACRAMIEETLRRGARDNVTVITVRTVPAPPPEDEEEIAASAPLAVNGAHAVPEAAALAEAEASFFDGDVAEDDDKTIPNGEFDRA